MVEGRRDGEFITFAAKGDAQACCTLFIENYSIHIIKEIFRAGVAQTPRATEILVVKEIGHSLIMALILSARISETVPDGRFGTKDHP